jgi:hypothetical protein
MGSLAVDASGDMALGYNKSSSSTFPSIAYSGRLVTDAVNSLPQTETQLQAGGGSQTNNCGGNPCARWGDYSSMSVDPSDDCTFWYTTQYYDTALHGAAGTWQTRIGAFKFPTCVGTAPTKLVFTTQPNVSYASNATITVKVSVEDASSNVVTTDTSAITIALTGGNASATLGGTTTVNAVAGVATFTLSVNLVGTAYKLHATDGSLTAADSSTFNITAGTAAAVTFTTQPTSGSNIVAGAAIPLVAHVADAAGNAVSGQSVLLGISNNPGSSTLSVSANPVPTNASGDATFSSLSLNKIGTGYTLHASDSTTPGATAATSNAFNIIAGSPAIVTLTTQPSAGQNIPATSTFSIVAHVTDGLGNVIVGDNVGLAFGTNAGSGTLTVSPSSLATDSSGNATFNNASIDKIGTGYTLKATEATGSHNVTSNAFNIVVGLPTQLVFTTQPTDVTQGGTLNTIAVTELDAGGNTITSDSATGVDFTVSACGGSALGSATMSSGVASLSSAQVFNASRAGLKVTANDGGLSLSVLSQVFNVGPSDLLFADEFEICSL